MASEHKYRVSFFSSLVPKSNTGLCASLAAMLPGDSRKREAEKPAEGQKVSQVIKLVQSPGIDQLPLPGAPGLSGIAQPKKTDQLL